jgi:hypothetical protein
MQKIKYILKMFAFILIIKASFLFSFSFLWTDLWLDLYKNIDSGIDSLEKKQYSYELKWWIEWWTIADKINRILKNKWLGYCKVDKDITEDILKKILQGSIFLLRNLMPEECSDVSILGDINQSIVSLDKEIKERAKIKTKEIQNISKIWLYSDWNIENSPFDIIEDIKQIDQIVFTQKIEYEWEKNIWDNELWDYLKWKLDKIENNLNKKLNKKLDNLNEETDKIINWEKEDEDKKDNSDLEENNIENINNDYVNIVWDKTKYSCPYWEDESWLSVEDLKNIINHDNSNWWNGDINNTIDENWIIDIDYTEYNPWKFWFSTQKDENWNFITVENEPYSSVNDNDFWSCETFFCITVEFITHNGWLLWESENTMSIQALLERSNWHLKKFANSSLIQSQMGTQNFELSLRDLDLSEIFSFWMIITKKTPPILDLQWFNDEVEAELESKDKKDWVDNNPLSKNNLLRARFESSWIDIKRENDLSIYFDRIWEKISVANWAELNIAKVKENNKKRKEILLSISDLNLHLDNVINSESNSSDTNLLYEEFLELERFTSEIQWYTNDLYKIVWKMVEIPILK